MGNDPKFQNTRTTGERGDPDGNCWQSMVLGATNRTPTIDDFTHTYSSIGSPTNAAGMMATFGTSGDCTSRKAAQSAAWQAQKNAWDEEEEDEAADDDDDDDDDEEEDEDDDMYADDEEEFEEFEDDDDDEVGADED